jgi:hypothetical protein
MKVKEVLEKVIESKNFYYVNVGRCYYLKPCYMLWVSKHFVEEITDKKWGGSVEVYRSVKFPVKNCDIKVGKSEKTLILKQGDKNLYWFEIKGGVKGSSFIDEIVSDDPDMKIFYFKNCHTEKCYNSDSGALILTKSEKVKISWHRTGKLLGKFDYPKGLTILYANGEEETINLKNLEEFKELEEELG